MKNKFQKILDWIAKKPRFHILFYSGLFFLLFPLIHYQAYANDLWKALYSGRYLALNWGLPSHAEFTFSPVVELVTRDAYNWLGNLVFYGLHQIGGIPALQIVLRMGLIIFTVILIHSIIKYKLNPLILLIFFFSVVVLRQKLHLRTAIFLIPFLSIFWWLWHQTREKGNWHLLWGFPVLFLFWGNMHGSYLHGFGFFLVVLLGDFIDKFLEENHPGWPWLGRLALTLLAVFLIITFIKPFPDYQAFNRFSSLAGSAFNTTFNVPEKNNAKNSSETQVNELNKNSSSKTNTGKKNEEENSSPGSQLYENIKKFHQNLIISNAYSTTMSAEFSYPADNFPSPSFLLATLLIFTTFFAFIVNPGAITTRELLVWLAASILGTAFLRTIPIIYLVLVPLLFIKAERGDFERLNTGTIIQIIALIGCLLIATNIWYLSWTGNLAKINGQRRRTGFGKHPRFSEATPEYVRKNYPNEEIYNDYNNGTYLIWKWWPEKKVFVDSKSSAYESDFMKEYRHNNDYNLIKKYDLKHVIAPLNRSFDRSVIYRHLIPHPQWEIKALDEGFIFFKKVEEAPSKNPTEYLLLSPEEFNTLLPKTKNHLQDVMKFIKTNQNQEAKIKKYKNIHSWKNN